MNGCKKVVTHGFTRPNQSVFNIILQLRSALGSSFIAHTKGRILNFEELNLGAPSQLNCNVTSA